jgi:hypothetical protein
MRDIVTHHFFRRSARARARKLNANYPTREYKVEPSKRGPARWVVVRIA